MFTKLLVYLVEETVTSKNAYQIKTNVSTIALEDTDGGGFGMKTDGIKGMVISFMFMYGDTAMLLAGFTF